MPDRIQTRKLPLAESSAVGEIVVVIDVLRAFSAEAVAFECGVSEILAVGTVEEALAWKQRDAGILVMGEVNGYRVPGFDLWNSPSELLKSDIRGRRLAHRTTAGTQGLLGSRNARVLLAASFLVASATAHYLHRLAPRQVDFIITGQDARRDGDEDAACADYIADLLNERIPDAARAAARVRASTSGRRFVEENPAEGWLEDLDLCLQIDRCDFALRVYPTDNDLIVRKVK